jgi:putative transcriptional regulator
MEAPASLSGQYLLAMPGIGDPRFEKAVIAMCAHDINGALGVGVSRIMPKITLHGLLDQVSIDSGAAPDCPIHVGGPVEPQRGFVLHTPDWAGGDTLKVGTRWGLTSTLDVLRDIAAGKGPRRWIVALGYAGWGEGQLDEEMTRHGWFAARADPKMLFDTPTDERWAAAFKAEGIDPRLLASETGAA